MDWRVWSKVLYSGLLTCGHFLSCPATLEKRQLLGGQEGSLVSLLVPEGTIQDGTWDGRSQGLSAQTGCLRRPGLKPAFHKLPVLGPGVYLRVRGIADLCQPTTLSSSNGWVPVAIRGRSHLFGGRVLSSFYLLSSSYSAAHIYIEIIHMCVGGTVAQAVAKHGRKGKVHWETSSDPALLLVH